jgi:hypothetical protein
MANSAPTPSLPEYSPRAQRSFVLTALVTLDCEKQQRWRGLECQYRGSRGMEIRCTFPCLIGIAAGCFGRRDQLCRLGTAGLPRESVVAVPIGATQSASSHRHHEHPRSTSPQCWVGRPPLNQDNHVKRNTQSVTGEAIRKPSGAGSNPAGRPSQATKGVELPIAGAGLERHSFVLSPPLIQTSTIDAAATSERLGQRQ